MYKLHHNVLLMQFLQFVSLKKQINYKNSGPLVQNLQNSKTFLPKINKRVYTAIWHLRVVLMPTSLIIKYAGGPA